MKTIVEEFKPYLMEDGKSNTTIQSCVGDVAGLLKYLETMGVEFDLNMDMDNISLDSVEMYCHGKMNFVVGFRGKLDLSEALNINLEKSIVR